MFPGSGASHKVAAGSGASVEVERGEPVRRVAGSPLIVIAFVLPFEVPLFRLGPLQITSVELVLETLADLGLAGVAVLAWLAFSRLRAPGDLSASGGLAGLGCGLAAGTFFVHGAVDFFLEFTPLFGLFWMLLGSTAVYAAGPSPAVRRDSRG